MHDATICAIVVTHNRKELLREALQALESSSVAPDVIVVDNNSTDGTGEFVEQKYGSNDSFLYYNTGDNLGGAGGFNLGLRIAYEIGYDYYWLMDDDTIVGKDSLRILLDAAQRLGQFGFLASSALYTDGDICLMNNFDAANDWSLQRLFAKEGIVKVVRATFVSFLTSRYVVEKVGLPIKEYFIWGDDTEYSLRISDQYPCYAVLNSEVVHKIAENQRTTLMDQMQNPERVARMELSIRNDCCTYRRRGPVDFARFVVKTCRKFNNSLHSESLRMQKIQSIAKGFAKGLVFCPHVEYVNQCRQTSFPD